MFNNLKIYLLLIVMLLVSAQIVSAESVNIRNSVSATANSGGNSGENITTGDAKASASVKNNISGNKVEVKNEVKAEANGQSVEINTENFEAGSQKIEATQGSASATIETNIETENINNNTVEPAEAEKELRIIKNIIHNISNATKIFFDNIISLF